MEAGDVGDIFQLEKLLAGWCVNVDLNLAVAFHIGTAVSSEDRINSIGLLEGGLVKTMEVIVDMDGGAAV